MNSHKYMLRSCKRIIPQAGLLLALLLAVMPAIAQSIQGAILGTVRDASGAVVPEAQVILTSIEEGTVRTTATNNAGDYQFLDVKAAHYSVQVVVAGFEKWATSGVQLVARQQLRVDAVGC